MTWHRHKWVDVAHAWNPSTNFIGGGFTNVTQRCARAGCEKTRVTRIAGRIASPGFQDKP